MLQHGDAEGGVEHAVSERQTARVSGGIVHVRVDAACGLGRSEQPIHEEIDAEQLHLGNPHAREADLGEADPAADVENPPAGPRP